MVSINELVLDSDSPKYSKLTPSSIDLKTWYVDISLSTEWVHEILTLGLFWVSVKYPFRLYGGDGGVSSIRPEHPDIKSNNKK